MNDTATFFKLAAERITANGGAVPPELWQAVQPMQALVPQKPPQKKYQSLLHENADRAIRKHLYGLDY